MKKVLMIIPLLVSSLVFALANDRPPRFEKAEDVVAWLYRDFGWECFIARYFETDILVDQPERVLARYFAPALAKMIVRDRAFVQRTNELGYLDFVLLFGSQDPDGIGNLRIDPLSGTSQVQAVYDQNGKRDVMEMRFTMIRTDDGWRVADIDYRPIGTAESTGRNFSLLAILSQPYPVQGECR